MTDRPHSLLLVPWHIGNRLDITLNAARAAREVRVFLAEEPALTRRQFETDLGVDCAGKSFLPIPEKEDAAFLREVLAGLEKEDVAVICSGGIPCFIDPGSWLVKRLRERKTPITALAGPSILSTMLSLSGVDWTGTNSRGTFVVYLGAPPRGGGEAFLEAARRENEPVFVFLNVHQFRDCLSALLPAAGGRLVSAFFDLTKRTRGKYPYADRVVTMSCAEWPAEAERIPWKEVSDVALMLHPREDAP